ncbi:MAG: TVP38/TMEM64 family protein [Pseudomonadota bacterium]
MNAQTSTKGFNYRKLLPLFAIIFVAAVGAYFLRDILSFDMLAENREALLEWRDANYLLAVLVFIAAYIVIVAFSLPGAAVMTLTGGFLFGLFPGALFTVLGATLGALVIFSAVKLGLGDYLHAKFFEDNHDGKETFLEKMDRELRENELSYLLILRLVPAVPFFLANLAPAFLGVSFRMFALTTFFGIMPGSIVYTSVGAGLGDVFAAGETPNLGIIFEWHILGPILGLVALAALPIIIKKFRAKGQA